MAGVMDGKHEMLDVSNIKEKMFEKELIKECRIEK